MDDALRTRLHDLTLDARRDLVDEIHNLLVGVYGLGKDGRFEPAATLPAVQALPEVAETRARLETYLRDEATAGLSAAPALEKLVKEVAFTHLNRLVAFKMMESRKLIRGTLDKHQASNAFMHFLAQHPDDETLYNAGSLPQDLLGEGPRDVAYRHFLLEQCRLMSSEIRLLFDPDNLSSRLFPRPAALRALVERLNSAELQEAWQAGNEETVGWIYQYFNEPDLAPYRGAKAPKVPAEMIAPKSQQYTPRWIVKYLVQNTLGRLWLQMHPDSRLRDQLEYLVPSAEETTVPCRLVHEITLLDPACGTMHFGLVAFDLFAAMYAEEAERSGDPGWPAIPSVPSLKQIPAAIIEHNLFGIDIDLRAVQLSALTLLLKARSLNPQTRINDHNLACADVLLLDGARLDSFIASCRFTDPVYERLLRGLWDRLKDANQLGSLLRLEAVLADLVSTERRRFHNPKLPGLAEDQFVAEASQPDYWDFLDVQIMHAFDAYARECAEAGRDERYFTGEAIKGLRVLRLMTRDYDIITTNPPYLDNRDLNETLKKLLGKLYPQGKQNLYAAFVLRCLELLAPDGRLGIVTPQTFMFISSFENLRKSIRASTAIESLVHTGLNTFPDAVVDCAFYVLRNEPNSDRRDNAIGAYFRLVREPDAAAKQAGFERALVSLRTGQGNGAVYRYRQGTFDEIASAPWIYWATPTLRSIFRTPLRDSSAVCLGMRTGDNYRFVRYWWEIGEDSIGINCGNSHDAAKSNRCWFPYMKGDGFCRWYGNQTHVVEWHADGEIIKADTRHNYPQLGENLGWKITNESRYFLPGVTYSYLTSGNFSARLSPGGFIFDVAGSSLFPKDIPLVLAILNSSFAAYALKLLNPTVNYQVGDLERLPIPTTSSPTLTALVERAVAFARADSTEDETTYDFIAPPDWPDGPSHVADRAARLAAVEQQIDEEVYRLYGISDADRAVIEAELRDPIVVDDESGDEADASPITEPEETPVQAPVTLTVAEVAQRWVSYAVGIVLGHFQPGVEGGLGVGRFTPEIAADLRALAVVHGVTVLTPGHEDDLTALVTKALAVAFGDAEAQRLIDAATGGRPLAEYLERDFFARHLSNAQYRKRPIYWLLQSPKKRYSLYVYHERMSGETLQLIRSPRYVGGALNAVKNELTDLHEKLARSQPGAPKRKLEREIDGADMLLADLEAFEEHLAAVTAQTNERGETVGWEREPDDGVLINLAPLRALIPSWAAEPSKAWAALARGEYDWAHTARRYWPDRVEDACRHNRSYAIAHGLTPEEGTGH